MTTVEEILATLEIPMSSEPKKAKKKRLPGRPCLYDHKVIVKKLRKYEGQSGGLRKAWKDLMNLKGYSDISFATVANVARMHQVKFKGGRPAKGTKMEKVAA